MLLAVLLGKELELALLGNIASGSQPLDGLETRLVRLSGHNAALVLHEVALLKTTRCVGRTAVEHLLLGSHRRDTTTTLLVIVAASQVVPAHHVVLTRIHSLCLCGDGLWLWFRVFGARKVLACDIEIGFSGHLVLPKQHIFFKEGWVSAHRKRTVLNSATDPSLQPFHVRNWI